MCPTSNKLDQVKVHLPWHVGRVVDRQGLDIEKTNTTLTNDVIEPEASDAPTHIQWGISTSLLFRW